MLSKINSKDFEEELIDLDEKYGLNNFRIAFKGSINKQNDSINIFLDKYYSIAQNNEYSNKVIDLLTHKHNGIIYDNINSNY